MTLVSVVIPTFRRPRYLDRAIGCVTAQSHTGWELIVVDDNDEGSRDRVATEAVMQRHEDHPRILYLRHSRNEGGAAARNTGIQRASGDYVAFLDDDDEWLPRKLEEQLECFARAPAAVAVVYTGVTHRDVTSGRARTTLPSHRGHILHHLLRTNVVGTTSAVMCTKQALAAVGLFDPSMPAAQDLDLYLRLASTYQFDYVANALVVRNKHQDERITKNVAKRVQAYDRLYEKHRALLDTNSALHSRFLQKHGRLLMTAGDQLRAEEKFARAVRLDRLNLTALAQLLFVRLGSNAYHSIKRVSRPFRALMQQLAARR